MHACCRRRRAIEWAAETQVWGSVKEVVTEARVKMPCKPCKPCKGPFAVLTSTRTRRLAAGV